MKRNQVSMPSLQTEVVLMDGGLNENVSSLEMKPGELISCKNYYITEGSTGGYVSLSGYERYDGQQLASTEAVVDGDDTDREAIRAAITDVPGVGSILGLHMFKGKLYAFRNKVGGLEAGMYVEDALAGWTEIDLGREVNFTSGGVYEIKVGDTITGATSSATAVITKVLLTSGTWAGGDAAGKLLLSTQIGDFQSENLNVGANLNVATIASNSSVIVLAPSGKYSFINYNFSGSAVGEAMFFTNGVGQAAYYDGSLFFQITTGMTTDTPVFIAAHGDRLWLTFSGGSLQCSTVGDPTDWVTGPEEFGVGYEITALEGSVGDTLIIFGVDHIKILEGSDSTTWVLKNFSDTVGAYSYTVKKLFDTLIFMSNMGVTTLSAAQEFGDFSSNSISEKIKKTLFKYKSLITCAEVFRALNQYRLFFSNGKCLIFSFFNKKLRGVTLAQYPNAVLISTEGSDTNGNPLNFFGSSTAFAYKADSGTSFDGAAITYSFSTAYYHYKQPRYWKRFTRITFEISATDAITFSIRPYFDYAGTGYAKAATRSFDVSAGGALWGEGEWGEMIWAGSDTTNRIFYDTLGVGGNMSLEVQFTSKYARQHTFQNFITDYIILGRQM